MEIVFSKNAWDDYTDWQTEDKKVVKKINELIREIQRTPYEGTGKPEALRYELAGLWSRRITLEHRLVYKVV
ncbi:MAG: Txe/YoeB family addiction module toxin, partial [Ignavibacteriaceae bacterium]|nr:Txe/YoeB family addiction module toxin [Ignavibacteriaceae bacterium]